MSAPLVIAVPAKGRLQENAVAFFARAGLELVKPRGARDYRGTIADLPGVEVAYLSASEIAQLLAQGAVHLGVTGEDLVREMIPDADRSVVLIDALGFGHANVVVAVPQAWIDVHGMADLDDVATAFRLKHRPQDAACDQIPEPDARLLLRPRHHRLPHRRELGRDRGRAGRRHRRAHRRHHHDRRDARRQWAQGDRRRRDPALAGEPASPRAPPIGATARTRIARHPARPHRRAGARARLSRSPHPLCRAATTRCSREARERFGVVAPFGGPTSSGMLTLHCPPARVHALAAFLRDKGAQNVSVAGLDYVFSRSNPLYAKLEAALG